MVSWVGKLKTFVLRNRPSQKPQLWENLGLALRRRVEFEVSQRLRSDWLDQPRVVELSRVGFDAGAPLRMEVVPRDFICKSLFLYGSLEISETRLVQSLLRPGMCLVDVGANIGYYSLMGARIVGPTGAVHAFEPNESIRNRLSGNVQLNGFQNVVVHREAVTKQTGTVRFYKSAWSENSGISSIIPSYGLEEQGEDVPCVTLDDFAATLGARRIDLLKIDVEGAELDVIAGGRRVLGAADAPAVLFEGHEVAPLVEALGSLGYHVRRVDYTLGGGLSLSEPDGALQTIFSAYEPPNYFAVKDPGRFASLVEEVNAKRPPTSHLLGRI
jgi:FkbM family methyltransferase